MTKTSFSTLDQSITTTKGISVIPERTDQLLCLQATTSTTQNTKNPKSLKENSKPIQKEITNSQMIRQLLFPDFLKKPKLKQRN